MLSVSFISLRGTACSTERDESVLMAFIASANVAFDAFSGDPLPFELNKSIGQI